MLTQPWFFTPLYVSDVHENEASYNAIQEELLTCCNNEKFSQVPGWAPDSHELNEDPFNNNVIKDCPIFLDFLHDNLMSYLDDIRCQFPREYVITSSWFTKTLHNKYAHLHDHGSCDVSGVYYLKTNGEDGNLLFRDPYNAYATNYIYQVTSSNDSTLPLEQGLIAFWPGMIQHRTQPNKTQHERISLSFNISFVRQFDGTCIRR